ncbi:MAG: alpha/beta fold hydrolase, partial [Deltaproteobacteria bacterium]|nr:alpha/beta fold hydrolase [Deltaproteobacteria bacterium]
IYYEAKGEGPAIVACNGICVSTFFWKYLVEYFSPHYNVVVWDYRSHGNSDPAPDLKNLTMEQNARDLACVMDAVGAEQALLLGHSMGVQTIFEFYRRFPQRVAGLIPVLGAYEKPVSSFLHTDKFAYVFPLLYHFTFAFPWLVNSVVHALVRDYIAFPGAKLARFVNPHHIKFKDMQPYFRHLAGQDMRVLFGMGAHMQKHSARDMLSKMDVPVLVVAGEHDLFTPHRVSAEMAETIPNAELLTVPKGSHAALVEQPELMNLRIEKFIRERLGDSAWIKSPARPARARTPKSKSLAGKLAAKSVSIPKTPSKKPAAKKSHAPAPDPLPRILKLFKAGQSQAAVARTLNEQGVPTLSGRGRWSGSQVGRLIKKHAAN